MSAVSGALSRVTTLVTLVALLVGTLVAVVTTRAGAEPAPAPSAPERRYAPGIDPSLDADATTTGLVLGPRGKLRDGVLVEAFSALAPTEDPVASDLTYEVGDAASHGAYRLHVPAGDYVVRLSSPDGATVVLEPAVYAAGTPVSVGPHEDRRLETVVMQDDQGAPVTGRVLDVDDTPADGASVYLVRPRAGGYTVRQRVETAADGTFTFPGVRRGKAFTVAVVTEDAPLVTWLGGAAGASTATTFTVPSGAATHALGDLRVLAGTAVTGRVTSPTGPVEAADVSLLLLDGHGGAEEVGWDWLVDGDETYDFPALPGTYTIGVLPYGEYASGAGYVYLGDTTDLDQAITFTVGSEPTALPDLVLSRRTIEVTVDVVDPAGVLGDPEESAVWLLDHEGDHLASAYPTGVGDRYAARLPFGTSFTVAAFGWDSEDWWLLGGTSDLDAATFVTTPATGTTFHAGTVSLTGTGLTAPVPALLGQARSGQVLAVETPQWSATGVVSTYQWLRDGWSIDGATAPAYLLRGEDVGHQVSVRVTGTTPGRRGVVTSEARLVGGGVAPVALGLPVVNGRPRLGSTLTATPGAWDVPGVTVTYQWLADGRLVGTGPQLTLGWDQVGTTISLTATATTPGSPAGTSTATAVQVAREQPRVVVERRGSRVLVRVVSPYADRSGKVTFFGGRPVGHVRLTARDRGRAWFDLDLLRGRTGERRVSARYGGNDKLAVAKSPVITVRVR